MTKEELIACFEKHEDSEFFKFDGIEKPFCKRKDLHAFLLLDNIAGHFNDYEGGGRQDIISAAEHDEIFLSVSLEDLAQVVTEEQVIDLIRCGVRIDSYGDGLAMFV